MASSLADIIRSAAPSYLRPSTHLRNYILRRSQMRVAQGPFAGMHYIDQSTGSRWWPKILGTYELELWPQVAKLLGAPPAVLVDVGAAEGFYAVGFARAMPTSRVVAFEREASGRDQLTRLAEINGVTDRIDLRGSCDPEALAAALSGAASAAVLCDVEGYEATLLDPRAVPALLNCPMLVEVHEFASPGVGDLLRRRFAATHNIDEISEIVRTRQHFPYRSISARLYADSMIMPFMDEGRPAAMTWLWMTPRRN